MKHLLYLSIVLTSMSVFAQSGWTKEKGELYSQITYSRFSSDNFYNLNGEKNDGNTFSQQSANLYGEYGITSRFTTLLNFGFFQQNKFENIPSLSGVGNLRFGLKYAISKKIPISIAIEPEIPIGPTDGKVEFVDEFGIPSTFNLPITDGEFNVWSTIAASGTALRGKIWYSAYYAHNFRTQGFSNQLQTGLEIGYKPTPKLYFKGSFSILSKYTDDPKPNVSFIRGEGTQNNSVSIGAGYKVYKNWGVLVDYYQGIDFLIKGRNTYLGPLFTAGITYSFKK